MPERIQPRTLSLLVRWVVLRQGRMCPRVRSWPEVHLRFEQHGLAIKYIPVFCTIRATGGFRGDEDVEEMGWAFLGLEGWKQYVLWQWFTMGREEWETFRESWRISRGKLRSILLDLQHEAIRRGLVEVEEDQLENAA